MPVPYTVTKLITDAYYLSGIVAREFQQVDGTQLNDGLGMLNDILGDKVVENDMIPYFSQYDLNLTQGTGTYFIPNLIQIDTIVFFIQGIRYEMTELQRKGFFGTARADNIQSLPFTWHTERKPDGANLYLYFLPDTNYPVQIWGLFRLEEVILNQDLVSKNTTVFLGNVFVTGTGTLAPQQLVINGIDFAGVYANAAALVTAINASAANVQAQLSVNVITLISSDMVRMSTLGVGDAANTITFTNFSTLDGPLDQSFLPMELDRFYVTYLKYALANRLCIEFNYSTPVEVERQLNKYELMISKRSQQLDMTLRKISTLGSPMSLNYAFINLGHGWTIGG
jgi:hypothetical protein